MNGKSLLTSKTAWLNAAAMAATLFAGTPIPGVDAHIATAIMFGANIALRFLTTQSIVSLV